MKWSEIIFEGIRDEINISNRFVWHEAIIGSVNEMQLGYRAYVDATNGILDVIGRVVVYKEVDGLVSISDISVDRSYRQGGIAAALVDKVFDLSGQKEIAITTGLSRDGRRFFDSKFNLHSSSAKDGNKTIDVISR